MRNTIQFDFTPVRRDSYPTRNIRHLSGQFFVVVTLLFGILEPGIAEEPTQKRHNILFIAVDDMRVELGCYGNSPALTPNIDSLASRGLLFDRAYCQQALCNPSRASLLTGKRPDTLRVWNLGTHFRDTCPDIVTLPQWFKQHGYHTRNIGKVFHNWRTQTKGDPVSWSVPAVMHFATHDSDRAQVLGDPPFDHAKAYQCETLDVADDAYFDGRIANLAVEALEELRDTPFFLAVGFWKPHVPFNAPKRYWDLYDRSQIGLPENPAPPTDVPAIALHTSNARMGKNTEETIEQRHGYYAGISYLDAQVGRVLQKLQDLNLTEKTIVVFWSDHGFHIGEHGLWGKTSNFELDARVPLIIAVPGSKHQGERSASLVELLDLYPTLVDLSGTSPPQGLEGVSLRPILENPQASIKQAAYTQHPRPAYYKGEAPEVMGYSVRTDRYRYTQWRNFMTGQVIASELYDHQLDPQETQNVVNKPIEPSQLDNMVQMLNSAFPAHRTHEIKQ